MKRIAVGKVVGAAIVCLVGVVGAVSAVRAGSVQNPYVELTGDLDFGGVTDDSIGVKRPDGPAEIQVKPRPGWEVDGPTNFVYESGKPIKIRVKGKDGEEIKEIWLEMVTNSCNHQVEQESIHQVDTGIGGTNDHVLAVYHAPEVGVPVKADLEWYVTATGMHKVVVTEEPCPNCEFGHGKQPDPTWETVVPEEPFDILYTYDGSQIERDKVTYYPLGTHKLEGSAAWISEKCSRCTCRATAIREYKVCRTSVSGDKYIGLDMTDAGKNGPSGSASAEVTPELTADVSATCQWETAPHCRFADDTMTATGLVVSVHDTGVPSATFMGERLDAKVTLKDSDGCEVADSLTHTLTVVQVDVTVDKVLEAKEETEGAWLYEIPDAANGEWTEEGTNDLREVKIEWYPKNLPDDQIIRISAPQSMLYEKKESESAYRPAKNSYTIKELGEREFWLHGHKRSGEYLGEQIEVTHDLSGARDLAKFTVFGRPRLVPDYDRDGKIDEKDEAKAEDGKTVFRFWINDDDDDGDVCSASKYCTDKPEYGKWDGENDRVDGRRDLVDFTPVWVDLSEVFPKGTPQSLLDGTSWYLKSFCLNAVWTSLKTDEVENFQKTDVTVCGEEFDEKSLEAHVVDLSVQEKKLPEKFRALALSPERQGIIFVEGSKTGQALQITGKFKEREKISFDKLDVNVTCVEQMYRWIGLCHVMNEPDRSMRDQSPDNWPDEECDDRMFVFVHGFNVNSEEAAASGAEVFKRLWQSGLKSKYAVVNWYGCVGQSWNFPFVGTVSLSYYANCYNAFLTAEALAKECNRLPSRKIMLAHSLGNVLTCAAIQNNGLQYSRYGMMNAALAMESILPNKETDKMVASEWRNVYHKYRSTGWHELFPSSDFRSSLTWKNIFKDVRKVVNYYSETEDIVCNRTRGLDVNHLWTAQELSKGTLTAELLAAVPGLRCISEGGWGVNSTYSFNMTWYLAGYGFTGRVPKTEKGSRNKMFMTDPLFTPFYENEVVLHTTEPCVIEDPEKAYRLRSRILSDGIPAESFAFGANAASGEGIESRDYATFMENKDKWPDNDAGKPRWAHSTFKNVAYFFMKKLYDDLVNLQ